MFIQNYYSGKKIVCYIQVFVKLSVHSGKKIVCYIQVFVKLSVHVGGEL